MLCTGGYGTWATSKKVRYASMLKFFMSLRLDKGRANTEVES